MSGKSKKVKGTKQTLEYVEQPEKFHVKTIKCKNQRQKEFLNSIDSHEVTICNGLAGSGKTYVALYYALKALEKGQCEKIYNKGCTVFMPAGSDNGAGYRIFLLRNITPV